MKKETNPVLPEHKIRKIWTDVYGAYLPGNAKMKVEGFVLRGVFDSDRPEGQTVAKFDRVYAGEMDITGIANMSFGGPGGHSNNLSSFCFDLIHDHRDLFYNPYWSEPVPDEDIQIVEKSEGVLVPVGTGQIQFAIRYKEYLIKGSEDHIWKEVNRVSFDDMHVNSGDPEFADLLSLAQWLLEDFNPNYEGIFRDVVEHVEKKKLFPNLLKASKK